MGRKLAGPAPLPAMDDGGTLMADGRALGTMPPTLAALTGDAAAPEATPLERMQAAADARAVGLDLLRPQPQQARLAYLMVLSSLDLA